MNILILCDDSYGKSFYPKLIEKIYGRKPSIPPKRAVGPKVSRIIKANFISSNPDKIIRIKDGEGNRFDEVMRNIEEVELKNLDKTLKDKVKIVILDCEIEEWICISKDIKFNCKPSRELRIRERYEKHMLPKYVDELDIDKLKRRSRSFRDFLNAIEDP